MIASFRHKGLRRLLEEGNRKGASAEHIEKIENIIGALDAADRVEDMDLPPFRLHRLISDLKGF